MIRDCSRKIILFISCILCAVLAFGAVALTPAQGYATSKAELQAQVDAAVAAMDSLEAKLDAVSDVYYTALAEQEAAQAGMDAAQAEIERNQQIIEKMQQRISSRVRVMYKSGMPSVLDVLFGSQSFTELVTGINILEQMNNEDTAMIEESKALRAEMERQKAIYEEQRAVAAQKAEEVRESYESAQALVNQQQALIDGLNDEIAAMVAAERAAELARQGASANDVVQNSVNTGTFDIPYDASTSEIVVAAAYSRLGCPYVWATHGPNTFDCSGLVYWCYQQAGVYASPASSWYNRFETVGDPQPGDVCVEPGHVGIYIGDGMIIHATNWEMIVMEAPIRPLMRIVRIT